jgi:hypothetical protein
MFNSLPFALTFISALTCGLMAGFFFTFSAFVMNGLGRLAATQSIAAMQFHQLDGMESGANSRGLCGRGIAHHCALFAAQRSSGVIPL